MENEYCLYLWEHIQHIVGEVLRRVPSGGDLGVVMASHVVGRYAVSVSAELWSDT